MVIPKTTLTNPFFNLGRWYKRHRYGEIFTIKPVDKFDDLCSLDGQTTDLSSFSPQDPLLIPLPSSLDSPNNPIIKVQSDTEDNKVQNHGLLNPDPDAGSVPSATENPIWYEPQSIQISTEEVAWNRGRNGLDL